MTFFTQRTLGVTETLALCLQEKKFHPDFGPNYHPTFEVRFPANTEEVPIIVQDQAQQTEVWRWDTDLTGNISNITPPNPLDQK